MADARFVPRAFTTEPELFGDRAEIGWRALPVDLQERVAFLAAQTQHDFAVKLRARMKEIWWTPATYARWAGMKPERLRRLLRGEIVAQTIDYVMAWELVGVRLRIHLLPLQSDQEAHLRAMGGAAKRR